MAASQAAEPVLIETPPAGLERTMVKYGLCYGYNMMLGMYAGFCDGAIVNTVQTDDGKLYMNNPWTMKKTNGWLEGTVADGVVTFQLPQLVNRDFDYDEDGNVIYTYEDYCVALRFEVEDEATQEGWYYPIENQAVRFLIGEDGTLTAEDPTIMLGQCGWSEPEVEGEQGKWSWQGNGDELATIEPVPTNTVQVPDGLEFREWSMVDGIFGRNMGVAFDGQDVYLRGVYERMPEAVVKGTLSDGKVTLPTGQYLGIYEKSNKLAYFLSGNIETSVDPDGEETSYFNHTSALTLTYDTEKQALYTDTEAYCISSTDRRVYYSVAVDHPYIAAIRDDVEVKGIPSPEIDLFYEEDTEYGWPAEVTFYIGNVDLDKNVIDTSKLYWELLMDDEVFEFLPDEYEYIDSPMTEVPYAFSDDEYEDIYSDGSYHYLVIHPSGYDSVALRTLYKDGDKTIYSDPVYFFGEPTSVDAVATDSPVVRTEYFDTTGRRVAPTARGLRLERRTHADGTVTVLKRIK